MNSSFIKKALVDRMAAIERIKHYIRLTRLNRPIGILLLLWPTLWALWIAASGVPNLKILTIFIAGTILMRSAGCVINDIADKNFDLHVQRTKERPLTSGKITKKEAAFIFILLSLLSFSLVLLLNRKTIFLSFAAILLAIIYPYTKRFTHFPQAFLGLAFGFAIPMAFSAQTDSIPLISWEIYLTAFLWAFVYDTMYAMVDRDDDLKIGIKSTAIIFGKYDKLIIGILQITILILLAHIGFSTKLNYLYWIALSVAAILFIYQQSLIFDRDRTKCFQAFLNNNYVGAIIFIGIALGRINW